MNNAPARIVSERQPDHWLHRLSPDEWMRAAMNELGAARVSTNRRQPRAALASARRAAGMAWNAVLSLDEEPDPRFGRSYVEHLKALAEADDTTLPEEVRRAAEVLLEDPFGGPRQIVPILTPRRDQRVINAVETVLAEAYTRLVQHGPTVDLATD